MLTKASLLLLLGLGQEALGQAAVWGQCGGNGWSGATTCVSGNTCCKQNDYYSQCLPNSQVPANCQTGGTTTVRTTTTSSRTTTASSRTSTTSSRTTTGGSSSATGLHAGMKKTGRYFGTFTDSRYLSQADLDPANYVPVLNRANEWGSCTPGNSQKWDTVQRTRGTFTWTADAIVDHCRANGQTVRGHTLVWHSQLPQWVKDIGTTAELRTVMTTHIQTVMGHWKGKIFHWDVVNEPFEDNGTMRNSVFYARLGRGYVAEAFRIARAVDPAAKLYLNEYNNDFGAKGDAFYTLAKELKDAGVPIDGVGIQGHWLLGGVPSGLQTRMERLAALGLDVALTEVDVRIQTPVTQAKLDTQKADFKFIAQACKNVPRCVGITVSSFTDKFSWVPTTFSGYDAAQVLDKSYQKKPAYYGVAEVFPSP